MVEKRKTKKDDKRNSDEPSSNSDSQPDVGGLAASLDALMSIADKGEGRAEGEVVHLSPRKDKKLKDSDEFSTNNTATDHQVAQAIEDEPEPVSEPLGIVELLSALKSDIDSLRKDNEEFKAQLMSSPAHQEGGTGAKSDGADVRSLLEALKADIGNLREENDYLRSRAFAGPEEKPLNRDDDHDLYGMLAELKSDIVSLRSENDALRNGRMETPVVHPSEPADEVAMMLRELKTDINDLKHENEALRLENLTARDGAHFQNLGGQQEAYRNSDGSALTSFLKGFAALVLVAAAAGGGYFLAKNQNAQTTAGSEAKIASRGVAENRDVGPAIAPPPVEKKIVKTEPVKAPVVVPAPAIVQKPEKPEGVKASPVAKVNNKPAGLSPEVETAMMTRADGLIKARDLGAARMVFVYLARHGSKGAMTRLAQTYDPQYLRDNQFDEAKNADVSRAIRLYGAAADMGDEQATKRLQELQ